MNKINDLFEKLLSKKHLKQGRYFLFCLIIIFMLWLLSIVFNLNSFLEQTEFKTLDLRFGLSSQNIQHNKDIVILAIDDTSLEILEDDLGRWSWSRDAYPGVIDYMEKGGVDSVLFDLMFIGYQKGFEKQDKMFGKQFGKYNNVYASMNFDYRENLNPPILPDRLKLNVEDRGASIDFSELTFLNCRPILDEIIKSTPNIGIINFARDIDGISRRSPILIKYQNAFYPYLAFKAAKDYIQRHENVKIDKIVLNKDNQVELGNRKIQLDKTGRMLINWYGPTRTFEYIPFYKAYKSAKALKQGLQPEIPADYFKNKIVFVGVTATSLFDIKSSPLSSIYPGVELQATVFNNIIDNNPVKKVKPWVNLITCLILCAITALSTIKLPSSFASALATLLLTVSYIIFAAMLLKYSFTWIAIVNPVIVITITFTFMYVIKYLMKSKDFEYTYKLATTDGLTGLHNHRYFQEYMLNATERSKRYKNHFSVVLIDIDFFKKFNDTYGHQIGDAVLRQVADLLKKTVRVTDLVARYGGEEMAIVLDNADTEEAVAIANKICKTIGTTVFKLSDTLERNVTISLGVATYPQHGEVPAELIEFADKGLYRAKESGRNKVGDIITENSPTRIEEEIKH